MEYRILPQSGLRVSRLSFGTMTFGSQADQATSTRMVDQCLDAGINFFDTANMYNKGVAEEVLGRALGAKRSRVVLASKVRSKMGEGADESGLSRAAILKAIDASLKRLGTDYLDIYYLHWPDYETPIEVTLAAMDEVVKAGKVRHIGVSNYSAWQFCEILWTAEKIGTASPHISQPMYNLLARSIEEDYLAFCKRFGVAVVCYNPLAGGLLTGKHQKQSGPLAGTRFDNNALYQGRYWHDDTFSAIEELRLIGHESGISLVQLSLQWLLAQPQVDSIILGASSAQQLEENLKACAGEGLNAEALSQCDGVWNRLRGITPQYHR